MGLTNVDKIKDLEKNLNTLLKEDHNAEDNQDPETVNAIHDIAHKLAELRKGMLSDLNTWDRVQIARHAKRPNGQFYIDQIFDDFIELHGDRGYRDDQSIVGGIATINGQSVTVIAQVKGVDTEDNIKRNFGMPSPEGYRKALRLMKQADKFKRPIVTLIDTPGAYPGLGAEERGQGEAIAKNLFEMSQLRVPILSIVIGEGGSGGALALGVCNKLYMLENSIYSILSPEGFATILWKDAKRAQEAAKIMKLTASDLKELGVCDSVINEPLGGAHEYPMIAAENLKEVIVNFMTTYSKKNIPTIMDERYRKFRTIGKFERYNNLNK